MKKFRFGYIQMHEGYDPKIHNAYFCHGQDETYIVAVDNLEPVSYTHLTLPTNREV